MSLSSNGFGDYTHRRWFFLFLQLGILAACIYWSIRLPAPGWSVAVLGFGAVIMSIQDKMSAREKAVWVILLSILLVIEMRAISKDRREDAAIYQQKN